MNTVLAKFRMSEVKEKLQCYNRTCGQKFDPDNNNSDSCLHHPGVPFFHDVYKKWSCCDKRTTDFTEFLNIQGCCRSYHSNVKPVEPLKPVAKDIVSEYPQPLEQKVVMERPSSQLPTAKLSFSIGASLQPMLDKMAKEIVPEETDENNLVVQPNAPCQNSGCTQVYKGEHTNAETCLYHPGMPVFHEGMKYWSCCVKRTTDFNSFLEQIGCTAGKHKWHKEKNKTQTCCRYDWHQTGNSVVISVYSKCPLPDLSSVEANPVKLHIHIVFGKEKSVFDQQIILFGVIDIASSCVTYLGSKVEIKLKKAELVSWKDLMFKEKIMDIGTLNLKE